MNYIILNNYKIIKPWTFAAKAFVYHIFKIVSLVVLPSQGTKSLKILNVLIALLFSLINVHAQNKTEERISAKGIFNITINGNDIFKINIKTSESDTIIIKSSNDGEYQNYFVINTIIKQDKLAISLNQVPFTHISDDKRNAHKVIAATLYLEIPKHLNLNINSDIGTVNAIGNFDELYIQLKNGNCFIDGTVKRAIVNTFGGNISVFTKKAAIEATSNNGSVVIEDFGLANAFWVLKTIDGNITVAKQE